MPLEHFLLDKEIRETIIFQSGFNARSHCRL